RRRSDASGRHRKLERRKAREHAHARYAGRRNGAARRRIRTMERAQLSIVERLISPDQLDQALTRERAVSTMRLGTRLLELNLITEEQLQGALKAQAANPARHLGEILL